MPMIPTYLCTDCMVDVYNYEPDMGDEDFTFAPGKCGKCHESGIIVWSPRD